MDLTFESAFFKQVVIEAISILGNPVNRGNLTYFQYYLQEKQVLNFIQEIKNRKDLTDDKLEVLESIVMDSGKAQV